MKPIRVLVVDDEADFASAIVERLVRRRILASAVFSGAQALDAMKETEYDAVVLDLKMPGLDGLQTLQAMKQMEPDIQVIVLTGHGTVASGIGGMQLGAADFLQKPVAVESLCSAIEAAAEKYRAARNLKKEQELK